MSEPAARTAHRAAPDAPVVHAAGRSRRRGSGWRGGSGWPGVVAGLLLLAVAVALAWWAVVPGTPVQAAGGLVTSPGPDDDVLATADGAFAALCLLAGVVVAMVLLWRGGDRLLTWSAVSLTAGPVAGVVAWQLGRLLGPAPIAAQQRSGVEVLHAPLDLSTPLVVLLWPGATACALFVGLLVWLLVRPPPVH